MVAFCDCFQEFLFSQNHQLPEEDKQRFKTLFQIHDEIKQIEEYLQVGSLRKLSELHRSKAAWRKLALDQAGSVMNIQRNTLETYLDKVTQLGYEETLDPAFRNYMAKRIHLLMLGVVHPDL